MGQALSYTNQLSTKLISIISPVFNEAKGLRHFHQALTEVIKPLPYAFEIIYVDDGSRDHSLAVIKDIQSIDKSVSLIKFSRNFGKEAAISAGLHKAKGDAVIVIDSDMQDPPHLIPDMVNAWMLGAEVVNMRRSNRDCDSKFKRLTAKYFYQIIRTISDVDIDDNVGDFRLLGRKAVNALNSMPEKNRFMKGLFSWIGFNKVTIDYTRMPRALGETKWKYWRLWNFALDGITGFSTAPLKISSYIGFFLAMGSFLIGSYFLIKTLIYGDPVHGFPTLFLTMLFMGGIQLLSIGIIGEYVSRLFIEIKGRPLYLIDEYLPARPVEKNHFIPTPMSINFKSHSLNA